MKKLITTAILLISTLTFAQEKQTEIYSYVNGVKQISPIYIIEDNVRIFEVSNGIKNISPSLIIEENKIYEVKSGVQQLFPKLEVRTDVPNVFWVNTPRSIYVEIID